jgi:hypothetical protein
MFKKQGVCCMDCVDRNDCRHTMTKISECHDCYLEGKPLETEEWNCGEKIPCDGFIEDESQEEECYVQRNNKQCLYRLPQFLQAD